MFFSNIPRTIPNPVTGKDILYYEIEIKQFEKQVYPNLLPAQLVGYDGISPGPSFVIPRGTETVVRFINNATRPNSVHLHGSPSRAPFDGWAEDVTEPGEFKDYYYPNTQSGRLLWYHDHAISIVGDNPTSPMRVLTDHRLLRMPYSVRRELTFLRTKLKTLLGFPLATASSTFPSSSVLSSTMRMVPSSQPFRSLRASGAMSFMSMANPGHF